MREDKQMKKLISIILILLLTLSAMAEIEVAALNGPTGMGLVKMMADEEGKDHYHFTLAGSADMITPKLIKGDIRIACVPANLASVLYNKTNGRMQVLAVNTLGVIYIVERGQTVNSISDLKGCTVYASGKGASPEYALNYLLRQNGLDPEKDVSVIYKSEHAECLTALMQDDTAIAMLPQPFVTVAQSKKGDIRIALDLTEEWDKLDNGSAMITGVVVADKNFVQDNPDEVKAFLDAYEESVAYVNENNPEAAALIGACGIVEEAVALKALPYCNIVCIRGEEMKTMLDGYLAVLYEQDAASVGGALPGEDFYFAG